MSYTYTKHSWEDKPSSNTPITAAKLNEIEEGIYQANTNKVDKVSGKQLSTNDFSNQDVTDLAEAKKNSHTHSNKSVLDSITNVKVNNWDNKVDKVTGKGLSTNDLTNDLKKSYDGAVTDSHTHDNKAVIDKFSESDGQLLYDGKEIKGGGGGTGTLTKEVVSALPSDTEAVDDVIYLLPGGTTPEPTPTPTPTPSGSEIDDSNISTTTTYSSNKIEDLVKTKANASDLTTHVDDEDIHVTQEEKNIWTSKPDINDTTSSANTVYSSQKIDSLLKQTILSSTLAVGSTVLIFNNSAITTNSLVDIYTDDFSVYPTSVTVSSGSMTLTFDTQSKAINVKVVVK